MLLIQVSVDIAGESLHYLVYHKETHQKIHFLISKEWYWNKKCSY